MRKFGEEGEREKERFETLGSLFGFHGWIGGLMGGCWDWTGLDCIVLCCTWRFGRFCRFQGWLIWFGLWDRAFSGCIVRSIVCMHSVCMYVCK